MIELYNILELRKFQIIGFIKSEGTFKEVPYFL